MKTRPSIREPDMSDVLSAAEVAVTGSILLDGVRSVEAVTRAGLEPGHFMSAECRRIFEVATSGQPFTTAILLERAGVSVKRGEKLIELSATMPADAASFAASMIEGHAKRTLLLELVDAQKELGQFNKPASFVAGVLRDRIATIAGDEPGADAMPEVVSLAHVAATKPDPAGLLIGTPEYPYMRIGSSMMLVAPSGAGKSTHGVQQDMCWALGRDCFGLTPTRPLRILTVQAENDPGDQHRTATGVAHGLGLSAADMDVIGTNTLTAWITDKTGDNALSMFDKLLQRHKPDILRIDPLLAFIGADPTKPEAIAGFCRAGLNTLARRHGCGIVVVHHPPKTNRLKREDVNAWTPSGWQYFASGGADLANWTRAMIVLWAEGDGLFRMIAAKRWPGWRDASGAPQFVRYIRHGRDGEIIWRDADPEQIAFAEDRIAGRRGPAKMGDAPADARALAARLEKFGACLLSVARGMSEECYGRARGRRAFDELLREPSAYGFDMQYARKNSAGFIGLQTAVSAKIAEYDSAQPIYPAKPNRGKQ